jgi:type I restriction enzyme S subunit
MSVPALRFRNDDGLDFPDWKETSLGELAEIIGGGTPDTSVTEYWGGNVQWFTPTEIKSKYASNSLRTITESGLKDSSAKLLPAGTLLFSSRATVGDVSIALNECTTNQGFQSMVVSDKNNKEFIYYWILNNKKTFLEKASGSTFLEISKKEIEKLLVQLPSIKEQNKIANFLKAVDERITQLIQMHDLLSQYKKGVMQKIFSQELRFKDDGGQDFPEWEELSISEIFHRNTHSSKAKYILSDGKFIIVDMGSISREAKLLSTKNTNFTNDFLTTNDLVMAKDDIGGGNIIGRVVQIPENNKYICSDHVYKLTLKQGYVSYFYYAINSTKVNKSFRQKANGTAQIGISNKTVDEQLLPVPSFNEQTKIANFLKAIDDKITAIQTQLKAVKQYKQGLLQQMFV